MDAQAIWAEVSRELASELGAATWGSWLAQARLAEGPDGALIVVTPSAVARDWVRRNIWGKLTRLWTSTDALGRELTLKSRAEYEAMGGEASPERPVRAAALAASQPARVVQPEPPAGLQARLTFETFVTGCGNEFAHDVARRVGAWSEGYFNPVAIHGPYGFGKTHLLNAVAWEAARTRPDLRVVYMPAERFLSAFIQAMRLKTMDEFKADIREADLLLIDDVQFFAGKTSTQEELFHTLAALIAEGRRVVLTADRAPSMIEDLDPRLRSHMAAGLVCGIEPADLDTRMGILDRKLDVLSRQQGFGPARLAPDVKAYLANRFTESVRELEGALNNLLARAGANLSRLTLDEAQAILRPHLRVVERRITVDDIQKAVAEYYSLKQADLLCERRTRALARPRQVGMWLCKQLTTRSLPDIGRRFGGRDHTTVLHAIRKIEELRAADPQILSDSEALIRKLRG